ncbi:CHAT domain-containing protein [Aspergillus stella-maris]|uniref:CHAT domain-containing protein n=1 Tax=Aspergillus stella-maris TaxID=1810926 RepID=UPI003CCE45A9
MYYATQNSPIVIINITRALLVAMEHTPGSYHLPFAAKEVEMLQDRFRKMGLHSIQPKPYKQDIILHLAECRIFHFAGHGYTDPANPSKSQLILKDGKDDLLTNSPFLAYLSACGTGRIKDERFINKRFQHVIGTLWSVNDETCVDMAKVIYRELGNRQVNNKSVCQGLHQAAREMRDCWIHTSLVSIHPSKPFWNASEHQEDRQLDSMELGGTAGLPRDIVSTETDMDGEKGATEAFWVPYVHFGV